MCLNRFTRCRIPQTWRPPLPMKIFATRVSRRVTDNWSDSNMRDSHGRGNVTLHSCRSGDTDSELRNAPSSSLFRSSGGPYEVQIVAIRRLKTSWAEQKIFNLHPSVEITLFWISRIRRCALMLVQSGHNSGHEWEREALTAIRKRQMHGNHGRTFRCHVDLSRQIHDSA